MRCTLVGALLLVALLPVYSQQPAQPGSARLLAESLDELLASKRLLDTVALEVRWTEAGKRSSVTIHDDGLGIHWQGKQFKLSAEQRLGLLRKLKAAKFLEMPNRLGELPKGAKPPKQQDPDRGYGDISLRIGQQTQVVRHSNEGPVNEEFVRLTKDLLTTCIKRSASGVGVDSLADGLQKVLDQKIDVRALKIEVNYLRHLACHTLEIDGLAAKVSGLGYWGEPFKGQKSLKMEELTAFIKKLQGEKFQELPSNVNPKYDIFLEITVRVLDKEHSTGGFGYHPDKSPEEQCRRFEAVWNASNALQPTHNFEKKKNR